MIKEDIIRQLESLKDRCKTMIDLDFEDNDPWDNDVKALDEAIASIKRAKRKDNLIIDLIRSHYDRTDYMFKKNAEDAASVFLSEGREQVFEYINAQIYPAEAWTTQNYEEKIIIPVNEIDDLIKKLNAIVVMSKDIKLKGVNPYDKEYKL